MSSGAAPVLVVDDKTTHKPHGSAEAPLCCEIVRLHSRNLRRGFFRGGGGRPARPFRSEAGGHPKMPRMTASPAAPRRDPAP